MKVLTARLPDVRRWVPHGHGWFTFWVLAVVVGMELFGRMAATFDYHDSLAAIILFCVGTFAVLRQKNDPHPALVRFGDWLLGFEKSLHKLKHEIGLDYRGEPPIPRRTPRKAWLLPGGFAVVLAIFAWLWRWQPDGWRGIALYLPFTYTLYVLGLSMVWTALLGVIAVGIYVPLRTFEPAIERIAPGSWSAVIAIYMLTGLFLSFAFPAIWPLSFAGLLLAACILAYVQANESAPALLWKSRQSQVVSSIPLTRVAAFLLGTASLAVLAVIVTAAGGALFARPEGDGHMPITVWLGSLAAWFVPGLVLVVAVGHWTMKGNDPARRSPPTLHLANPVTPADFERLRRTANDWGWHLLGPTAARTTEAVAIALVPKEQSEAREFEPAWPLKVSFADLADPVVKDRLVRRDELQLRRLGFRGLAKLFKRTGRGGPGDGVLFAPQWWFIDGLAREAEPTEDETDDDVGLQTVRRVGPGFDRILPARVRQHWHAVLRATKVDLIFVEDGIKGKSVERVLRQIMTVYDRTNGKLQVDDVHFQGVPKVKCMVHEYGTERTFDPGRDYPEPKFLELTRARVLHVFKDRGDQPELHDIPFDHSWEPSPLALV
jgi:hypothetical protein